MNILIGNGASLAVWEGFGYNSIYEEAHRSGHLLREDIELFESLNTKNFEQVLSHIRRKISAEYLSDQEADILKEQHADIKETMCKSIVGTHIARQKLNDRASTISEALGEYNFIFSTNYDLLVYWSILNERKSFVDYFWNKGRFFDPANTQVWYDKTKILYLHGALHLEVTHDRKVRKKNADGKGRADILRQVLKSTHQGDFPLVITEGNSEQKMLSIRKSDYLRFALEKLSYNDDPLVIFGQSLSPQDNHLIKALERTPRTIAVSVWPGTDQRKFRRGFNSKLQNAKEGPIHYFNSETHPLGHRCLRVEKYQDSGKDDIRNRIRTLSQFQTR